MSPLVANQGMRLRWILMTIWTAWCTWWLIDGLCTYGESCTRLFAFNHLAERRMTGLLAVMFSGFPLGFFIPASISDLMQHFKLGSFNAGAAGYITEWLVSVAAGYLQWFVAAPFLWTHLCRRRVD